MEDKLSSDHSKYITSTTYAKTTISLHFEFLVFSCIFFYFLYNTKHSSIQ